MIEIKDTKPAAVRLLTDMLAEMTTRALVAECELETARNDANLWYKRYTEVSEENEKLKADRCMRILAGADELGGSTREKEGESNEP